MIARIWHGKTPASKADAYVEFTEQRAIPDYGSVEGNCTASILRRIEGDEAHFLTLTFWDSKAAIERFAGPDIERAKYYPEDGDFLLEFEPTVTHYEVSSTGSDGSSYALQAQPDRGSPTITRVWRGWTDLEEADTYERLLKEEIFPEIAAEDLAGYGGVCLLRRSLDSEVEFSTIMWFDSWEDVKQFAGEDYEEAYVPPKARRILTRFDERSQHYEMRKRLQ